MEEVTKAKVMDEAIKCNRGIMVPQDWFTQGLSINERLADAAEKAVQCLDDALWCCSKIKEIEAASAEFRFKQNSSYWPEYSSAPALNMLDIFKK